MTTDFELRWRELITRERETWWSPLARGGLRALSVLYGAAVSGYRAGYDLGLLRTRRLPCPVVSVGNLTVGGTGKTTTVRWITRRLLEWGRRPAILSYGYRSGADREAATIISGPDGVREPVEVSGDEPQLLARSLPGVPVVIGRKRVRNGETACREFHPDVLVMDDAFQYWRLVKDLEIVLIDATNPFGFDRLFPRGMLREHPRALARAHAAIITHAARVGLEERRALRERIHCLNPDLPMAETRHAPIALRDLGGGEPVPFESLQEGAWGALSSLARPESFERTLGECGARSLHPFRFRDHHPYSPADLAAVCDRARAQGLVGLVTTEKDAVKIRGEWVTGLPLRVLEIDLEFLSGRSEFEERLRVNCKAPKGPSADLQN